MDIDQFTDKTLYAVETLFQRALLNNEVAALDKVLYSDARFVGPVGSTIDKATDMDAHRAHALTLTVVDEIDREVQVIGGVGITRTTLHLVGAAGEHELDVVPAYTRAWIPSEYGWLIAAAHGGAGAPSQPGVDAARRCTPRGWYLRPNGQR